MQNTVKLLGYYGSDETHACSAWVSTSRELTEDKRARIPKMLKSLADAGHHTVFEKSALHFLVNSDIASHIHLLKHRIGVSINAESARYKELKEDKFYLPEDWITSQIEVSCNNTRINETYSAKTWDAILRNYTDLGNDLYHKCVADLEPILGRKRAKESARFLKLTILKLNAIFNLIGVVLLIFKT